MFWLLLCFFSGINASDDYAKATLPGLPPELREKIAKYEVHKDVKTLSKQFYEQFLIPELEYHENPEAIARANLSARNFDLEHFQQEMYADMPPELREKNSQEYQKFMQDPMFFIKFVAFYEHTMPIPEYLKEKIKREEIKINDKPLQVFTALDQNGEEISHSKCIYIETPSFLHIDYISAHYGEQLVRLVGAYIAEDIPIDTGNQASIPKKLDASSDNLTVEGYSNWHTQYIVQDSIEGNTIFHTFQDTPLAKHKRGEIIKDLWKVKNWQGETVLFYDSFNTIRLFPQLYINERNNNGYSALGWQLYRYRKLPVKSEETRNNLIKNMALD